MNYLSLYVYVKKWIIVVIVNKLVLVYFTWFVHNFVNHNYNVLLKKNDVCLMPLNICVCVSRPFIVKTSSVWNSWNVREQIKDYVLKSFLFFAKSLYPIHTLEARNATNWLGCVSLAKDWIQYSSTFVTLSRFDGGKKNQNCL